MQKQPDYPLVFAICGAVAAEVVRAETKHPTPIHNVAEAYAIILEELQEFWDEVRMQTDQRDAAAMRKELIQTAAMCVRTILDIETLHP